MSTTKFRNYQQPTAEPAATSPLPSWSEREKNLTDAQRRGHAEAQQRNAENAAERKAQAEAAAKRQKPEGKKPEDKRPEDKKSEDKKG